MACESSWASSASGCTAGVAPFHLFPIFLLGPACWLRHGVLTGNAEVQGNKREYSASLKRSFRWHAVTSAHRPVTEPSNVAWPNVKRLRSTVGWRGGHDKSMAAGSNETNDVIQRWPWFPPSDGLCHSPLVPGTEFRHAIWPLSFHNSRHMLFLLSQFAWFFSFLPDFTKLGCRLPPPSPQLVPILQLSTFFYLPLSSLLNCFSPPPTLPDPKTKLVALLSWEISLYPYLSPAGTLDHSYCAYPRRRTVSCV